MPEVPGIPPPRTTAWPPAGLHYDDGPPVDRIQPRPCVRLVASYAATDGRLPESVEITWETQFPSAADLGELIGDLAELPTATRPLWTPLEPDGRA